MGHNYYGLQGHAVYTKSNENPIIGSNLLKGGRQTGI
jgi:hypothetical protein